MYFKKMVLIFIQIKEPEFISKHNSGLGSFSMRFLLYVQIVRGIGLQCA